MILVPRSVRPLFAFLCPPAGFSLRVIAASILVIGMAFCFSAGAQTAQFSGARITVSSAVGGPKGVAVDGSGNIFFADTPHNAVKEITAASGYTNVLPQSGCLLLEGA